MKRPNIVCSDSHYVNAVCTAKRMKEAHGGGALRYWAARVAARQTACYLIDALEKRGFTAAAEVARATAAEVAPD